MLIEQLVCKNKSINVAHFKHSKQQVPNYPLTLNKELFQKCRYSVLVSSRGDWSTI